MSLTKTRILNYTEIIGDFKIIQACYAVKITSGSQVIATSYERESYTPDLTITDLPTELQPYANVAWTTDVINSYTTHISSSSI